MLNVWCSIHAFNVRFMTYTFNACFTYGKRTLHLIFAVYVWVLDIIIVPGDSS